jgi:hypothetical protein
MLWLSCLHFVGSTHVEMSPFDLGFQLLLVLKHLRGLFDVNSRGRDAESRAVMRMEVYPHSCK